MHSETKEDLKNVQNQTADYKKVEEQLQEKENIIKELQKDKNEAKSDLKIMKKKVKKHKYRYKTLIKIMNDQQVTYANWAIHNAENKENQTCNSRTDNCQSSQSMFKRNQGTTYENYLNNATVQENSYTNISRVPSQVLSGDQERSFQNGKIFVDLIFCRLSIKISGRP